MEAEVRGFERSMQNSELFHRFGLEIISHVNHLYADLSADVEQGWCGVDAGAWESWFDLERSVQLMPVPDDLDDLGIEYMENFRESWHTFHTALPFSEAERAWLLKCYRDSDEPMGEKTEVPRIMGHYEERIVTAGLRQVIKGRELVRRWLAWRRETDEYTDQGTLEVARASLERVASLFGIARAIPQSDNTPSS